MAGHRIAAAEEEEEDPRRLALLHEQRQWAAEGLRVQMRVEIGIRISTPCEIIEKSFYEKLVLRLAPAFPADLPVVVVTTSNAKLVENCAKPHAPITEEQRKACQLSEAQTCSVENLWRTLQHPEFEPGSVCFEHCGQRLLVQFYNNSVQIVLLDQAPTFALEASEPGFGKTAVACGVINKALAADPNAWATFLTTKTMVGDVTEMIRQHMPPDVTVQNVHGLSGKRRMECFGRPHARTIFVTSHKSDYEFVWRNESGAPCPLMVIDECHLGSAKAESGNQPANTFPRRILALSGTPRTMLYEDVYVEFVAQKLYRQHPWSVQARKCVFQSPNPGIVRHTLASCADLPAQTIGAVTVEKSCDRTDIALIFFAGLLNDFGLRKIIRDDVRQTLDKFCLDLEASFKKIDGKKEQEEGEAAAVDVSAPVFVGLLDHMDPDVVRAALRVCTSAKCRREIIGNIGGISQSHLEHALLQTVRFAVPTSRNPKFAEAARMIHARANEGVSVIVYTNQRAHDIMPQFERFGVRCDYILRHDTAKKRHDLITRFNRRELRTDGQVALHALIVNPSNDSAGLNLQDADIIIMEPVSTWRKGERGKFEQMCARVRRVGTVRETRVITLGACATELKFGDYLDTKLTQKKKSKFTVAAQLLNNILSDFSAELCFPWELERLLWIAHRKRDGWLGRLPKDVLCIIRRTLCCACGAMSPQDVRNLIRMRREKKRKCGGEGGAAGEGCGGNGRQVRMCIGNQ